MYIPTATTAKTSAAIGYAYQPYSSRGVVALVSSPSYRVCVWPLTWDSASSASLLLSSKGILGGALRN